MHQIPPFFLDKRGKKFTARFRWKGEFKRIKLGVGNEPDAKAEAKAWLESFVAEEAEKDRLEALRASLATEEKALHHAGEWLQKYLKEEYVDKKLAESTTKQAEAYLQTLLLVSKVIYLEEFTRTNVKAALAEAQGGMTPKRKFGGKEELSIWTTSNLTRAWKKFGDWLSDHEEEDLVNPKAFSQLKSAKPPAENKQTQLWPIRDFKIIVGIATDLDKELYGTLRWCGTNPADCWEFRKKHFIEEGKGWKLVKKRAKIGREKTGSYDQVLSEEALKILRPRIEICEYEDDWIFPEIHETNATASSFTSSFGNRNDDYWDMHTFKVGRDKLIEVRKGKDHGTRFAAMESMLIKRKVRVRQPDGTVLIEEKDRYWKDKKSLPNTADYEKKRKVRLVASLRHTFFTHEVERGTNIMQLRAMGGHVADSRTLERFYAARRSPGEIARNPLA
jgi:hypothetical protein